MSGCSGWIGTMARLILRGVIRARSPCFGSFSFFFIMAVDEASPTLTHFDRRHFILGRADDRLGGRVQDLPAVPPERQHHARDKTVLLREGERQPVALDRLHLSLDLGKIGGQGKRQLLHGTELFHAQRLVSRKDRRQRDRMERSATITAVYFFMRKETSF